MPNFPTNPRPSYPIEEQAIEPEVLISRHRDGSEQRRYKGSGKRRRFKLSFGASMPITDTQRQLILTHYDGQNGALTSFTWSHPESAESIMVRYAAAPAFRLVGFNCYEGDVELQEVTA